MGFETEISAPSAGDFVLSFPVFQESTSDNAYLFLSARLVERDRARLKDLFLQGYVRFEGRTIPYDQQLKPGQELQVTLPNHREYEVNTAWKLLWENEELLAVYKPHLLPVSRTTRNLYNTLISLIRRETPYADAHLLHRLDTETAGIILLAKNSAADKKWKPKLNRLITRKIYHAWVSGSPDWDEKIVECELAEKLGSEIRSQVYVVDSEAPELYLKPKQSKTAFRVLKRERDRTLIECELFTGRKHQIRAHLARLGHPIIGDKIYSHEGRFYLKRLQQPLSQEDIATLGSEYQLLSASALELQIGDERMAISSEADAI